MIIFGVFSKGLLSNNYLSEAENLFRQNNFVECTRLEEKSYVVIGFQENGNRKIESFHFSNDGILIGEIYDKNSSKLLPIESSVLFTSSFKKILGDFWGSYLLIQINRSNNTLNILRDPSGQESLFYLDLGDTILFSNKIFPLLFAYHSQSLEFNDDYFVHMLCSGESGIGQTAFKNVYELPSGCSITLGDNPIIPRVEWNPFVFRKNALDKKVFFQEFTEKMSMVVSSVMAPYTHIYTECSGGLDSTGISYFLKKNLGSYQDLKSINIFHSKIAASNELQYAKEIAKSIRTDLIEVDFANCLPFSPAPLPSIPLNTPSLSLIRLKLEETIFNITNYNSSSKFFSGEGGDHIFMCPPAVESLCDLIINKQFRILFAKIKEIAMQLRISFWKIGNIIINNCYQYLRGINYKNIEQLNYFRPSWLTTGFPVTNLLQFNHPIFEDSVGNLPGQFYQINAAYIALNNIQSDLRGKAVAYPLLSQPIMEIVFSVPTYELYDQGYDRYLFREIVSNYFNTSYVWRKDKGETSGVYQLAYKANKKHILDLVLDGYFASKNMIDKDQLSKTIDMIITGHAEHQWYLLCLISLELFIKNWKDWWVKTKENKDDAILDLVRK